MSLNTLERDDLLRRIAWLNAEVDKIKRMLKGEQVGTARIADAAITNAKIGNASIDSAKIQDAAITNAKIGNASIDSAKIQDAAITNAKIKDLTWDKAQGGFAVLGGLNGVSGILQVKDADGNLIITLDENGMTYSDGETNLARFGQWEE